MIAYCNDNVTMYVPVSHLGVMASDLKTGDDSDDQDFHISFPDEAVMVSDI